uniref:Uncharacterized protein n=1 Tax=Rousettus aegyptiacus TaxID=9407 RepID=A0A7J8IN34_ROUAE|nr:hypothetical protein HJG63_010751 [Rousettus aegyptiacus]
MDMSVFNSGQTDTVRTQMHAGREHCQKGWVHWSRVLRGVQDSESSGLGFGFGLWTWREQDEQKPPYSRYSGLAWDLCLGHWDLGCIPVIGQAVPQSPSCHLDFTEGLLLKPRAGGRDSQG